MQMIPIVFQALLTLQMAVAAWTAVASDGGGGGGFGLLIAVKRRLESTDFGLSLLSKKNHR